MSGRLALVHDWLTGMRGGEKALEVICERFPDAELFTLVHVRGSVSPVIERRLIHTSFLQALPGVRRYYRQCLPAFPTAVEQFDLDRFDLVLSVSHCAVKSVLKAPRAKHLCYCLTPMRYAWDQFDAYFGPERLGPVGSRLMRPVMARLARWDRDTAGRVDRYVANSQYVAGRIGRYYNRVARVVYPPVDTEFFTPDAARPRTHYLIVSALVPYKRVELAMDACSRLGRPLVIAGDGPDRARLETRADGAVTFTGSVPDDAIRDLYRSARAVLLPGEEDFGIVPVEAQACETPVIAFGRGGALETVADGHTGIIVPDATVDGFASGIERAERTAWDRTALRQSAERFSRRAFADGFAAVVGELRTGTGTC